MTLKAGSLAKEDQQVVDEAILDVVELVDVLHNCAKDKRHLSCQSAE